MLLITGLAAAYLVVTLLVAKRALPYIEADLSQPDNLTKGLLGLTSFLIGVLWPIWLVVGTFIALGRSLYTIFHCRTET